MHSARIRPTQPTWSISSARIKTELISNFCEIESEIGTYNSKLKINPRINRHPYLRSFSHWIHPNYDCVTFLPVVFPFSKADDHLVCFSLSRDSLICCWCWNENLSESPTPKTCLPLKYVVVTCPNSNLQPILSISLLWLSAQVL
jgi:hypothetical protein